MRYEKSQALLHLAYGMQGTRMGLSLPDIQERFSVSRRTAERMRDAVREIFPNMEEVDQQDGLKRWRILPARDASTPPVTMEELTALLLAAGRLRQDGHDGQARLLEGVEAKLRSLLPPNILARMEPDYEALLQSEGLAMRPGPRPRIDKESVTTLREAIKGCEPVTLHYRARGTGAESRLTVHPYGFLYGNRHYLVGFLAEPGYEGFRLFSLSNILAVEPSGKLFERDPSFSLADYAANAFGIFQETPVDVVWRISPEAADDARDYLFHPSQTMEEQPDGSLIVRFHAGGLLEMCWHLFTWGGAIRVVEPPELVEMMQRTASCFVDP